MTPRSLVLWFSLPYAVLGLACGSDGDGSDLKAEIDARIDQLCARANECYQPDAKPGDENWCYIRTADDGGGRPVDTVPGHAGGLRARRTPASYRDRDEQDEQDER